MKTTRAFGFALSFVVALWGAACDDAQETQGSGSGSSAGGSGAASATGGAGASSSSVGGGGAGGGVAADRLPVGIPTPTFGYELDTDGAATLFVDNTDPDCDDAVGSADAPYCDLFRGQSSVTYEAGAIVHVLGGPYTISGDLSLTMNGSEGAPVIIKGIGVERMLFDGGGSRVDFTWSGSYGVLENIGFYHMTRHRIEGDHLVFHDISVTNPVEARIDFNPVVNVSGHDVLFYEGEIGNNRRDNDTDSHGFQAGEGSYNVWLLHNEIYNNNGDSFQACHQCFGSPPHHVYIGGNVMHDDRENAVDLKTIHDVVVSENVMYGYGSSTTSGGDAMVVGSNGFDDGLNQGPRRVWVLHNELRDSSRALRIEGSEDVWVVGNVMSNVNRGLQIDDKPHRVIVVAANTIVSATDGMGIYGCQPTTLTVQNNIVLDVVDRHIDFGDCTGAGLSIENNLFFNTSGGMAVRVDGTNYTDLGGLDATAFASNNVNDDPLLSAELLPQAGSGAIDAGGSLDSLYAAFQATIGENIAVDRARSPRPAGAAEDIGAYEVSP